MLEKAGSAPVLVLTNSTDVFLDESAEGARIETVFVSTVVEASVHVASPAAFVVAGQELSVLFEPVTLAFTVSPDIGLELTSFTTKRMVEVELPSAGIGVSAVMLEVTVEGSPGANTTVSLRDESAAGVMMDTVLVSALLR